MRRNVVWRCGDVCLKLLREVSDTSTTQADSTGWFGRHYSELISKEELNRFGWIFRRVNIWRNVQSNTQSVGRRIKFCQTDFIFILSISSLPPFLPGDDKTVAVFVVWRAVYLISSLWYKLNHQVIFWKYPLSPAISRRDGTKAFSCVSLDFVCQSRRQKVKKILFPTSAPAVTEPRLTAISCSEEKHEIPLSALEVLYEER